MIKKNESSTQVTSLPILQSHNSLQSKIILFKRAPLRLRIYSVDIRTQDIVSLKNPTDEI